MRAKGVTVRDAVGLVRDGATVVVGGSGAGHALPQRFIDELAAADLPLDDGLAAELDESVRVFATDDMLEGATAFLAKRAPRYRGR